MFEKNQILYMRFQCIDMYGCPKLLDMGCHHLVAPNMWRSHMTLHAQGVFGGEIPSAWLLEQNSHICQQCLHICLKTIISLT